MILIVKKNVFAAALLAIILNASLSLAQTNGFSIRNDTITFSMQRVTGFGPTGFVSFSTGSYKELKDTEDFPIYPQNTNIPPNLSNISQWLHFVNQFQFYYQNYVSGKLDKAIFLKKAAVNNWNLSDTTRLSAKPLQCAFTVLAGTDSAGNEMYIVDANNNNDYSDDVIRPLLKNVNREDQVVNNTVSIKTSYLDNGVIVSKEILAFIQRGRGDKLEVSIAYPQFDFMKITYKQGPYIICALRQFQNKLVGVMADRPYFSGVAPGVMVSVNRFINIAGDNFLLIDYDFNKQTVTLKGPTSGFSATPTSAYDIKPAVNNNNIISDQVGFVAPVIAGNNINPLSKKVAQVTLSALRGRYVFVDFWSTYCGPCIMEMPYLNAAYQKYSKDKFEIIGVFDERDPKITRKLIIDNKVAFPNILMNSKSTDIAGYGHVSSFPTNYLIDPEGKIIGYNLRHEDLMNRLKAIMGF